MSGALQVRLIGGVVLEAQALVAQISQGELPIDGLGVWSCNLLGFVASRVRARAWTVEASRELSSTYTIDSLRKRIPRIGTYHPSLACSCWCLKPKMRASMICCGPLLVVQQYKDISLIPSPQIWRPYFGDSVFMIAKESCNAAPRRPGGKRQEKEITIFTRGLLTRNLGRWPRKMWDIEALPRHQ